MPKRAFHTTDLIKHRLTQAEGADRLDPMELVGLFDELARLERKWRMQLDAGSERRTPEGLKKLDAWYRRLTLLIQRALRQGVGDDEPAAALLRETLAKCVAREDDTRASGARRADNG